MKIYGFQKLSLLDYPGKMACTVFTGGCNLRCPFCHNASLVVRLDENEEYSQKEIFDFLEKRRGILDGVAITGGEPLMWDDTEDFMRAVKDKGFTVKLDTNGCFPHRLERIIDSRLADYIAMDVKNSPERYAETVGIPSFELDSIYRSISLLINGSVDYEFRTTVVNELHSAEDFIGIASMLKGAKRLYLQQFKDSGDLIGGGFTAPSEEKMNEYKTLLSGSVNEVFIRGV